MGGGGLEKRPFSFFNKSGRGDYYDGKESKKKNRHLAKERKKIVGCEAAPYILSGFLSIKFRFILINSLGSARDGKSNSS